MCEAFMTYRDAVLSTIQDKLNNPSPDDPFEPEIAAVSAHNLRQPSLYSRVT